MRVFSPLQWERTIACSDQRNIYLAGEHEEALVALDHEGERVWTFAAPVHWAEHGARNQWQLVDWCHAHCKEWTPVANGCAPIAVEQVGIALGKSSAEVKRLRQEAIELNQLDEIFAGA